MGNFTSNNTWPIREKVKKLILTFFSSFRPLCAVIPESLAGQISKLVKNVKGFESMHCNSSQLPFEMKISDSFQPSKVQRY